MRLLAGAPPRGTTAYTHVAESPFAPAETASAYTSLSRLHVGEAWQQLMDTLISIRFLQEDWDGEGSVAPDANAVAGATKLALALKAKEYTPADRVTASVNGTVVFEWHTSEGYQEIEVTSPIDAELRWVAKGSRVAEITAISIG
jgi:hypothetical protein